MISAVLDFYSDFPFFYNFVVMTVNVTFATSSLPEVRFRSKMSATLCLKFLPKLGNVDSVQSFFT